MKVSRKIKDGLRLGSTLFSAILSLGVLIGIFIYVFSSGSSLISLDLIKGNYSSYTYTFESENLTSATFAAPSEDKGYFSSKWGVAFKDEKDTQGNDAVVISYLDEASPVSKLSSSVQTDEYLVKAFLSDGDSSFVVLAKNGAENAMETFEKGTSLTSVSIKTKGGGIRGSLLATLILIAGSLLIALPLGLGASIYFVYFAPKNKKWVQILEKMIDITSGIPSIVFGLIGVSVFIPLCNGLFLTNGGSLLSGSFTMALILLPTIVKTSKEALDDVPKIYEENSLALGASRSETLYKVIIPSAMPGILSAVVLSIGRIIGESAALVYAIGTYISDSASLLGKSAPLAVLIWSLLSGENPNYKLASSIAIIILVIVSLISLSIRGFSYLLKKKGGKA